VARVARIVPRVVIEERFVMPQPPPDKSAPNIMRMFDRISPRYDFLNRMLSFRRDVYWRRRIVAAFADARPLRVLDLATGTGDVLIALSKQGLISRGVGADIAANMLARAHEKTAGNDALSFVRADGMDLPFGAGAFDAVTIAFGLRNMPDAGAALREMHRVLKPGGRLVVLEFSLPDLALLRWVYLVYFRHVLPVLGGLISGDYRAYGYLNRSVEYFPHGAALCRIINTCGFQQATARPMTAGIATLYSAGR
jgi:demethylmenaquinone methyltransferase / 2-methoxy-6-polyprenyl-1,4-benzoquinol methylase